MILPQYFLTGRPQWKVELVFISRIHDPFVEIMAETIFHTTFSMSQSLFGLDEGVSLECEGRTCCKNLDPSILKRVWSSEYDQPHNSHDHCHIVLEDNLISSQTIITSSCEREHSSSFTSDGSERAAEVLLLWQRESAAVLIGQRPTR